MALEGQRHIRSLALKNTMFHAAVSGKALAAGSMKKNRRPAPCRSLKVALSSYSRQRKRTSPNYATALSLGERPNSRTYLAVELSGQQAAAATVTDFHPKKAKKVSLTARARLGPVVLFPINLVRRLKQYSFRTAPDDYQGGNDSKPI